jgi:hypothetical protein
MMISLTNDNEFRQSASCPAALCVIITADTGVLIVYLLLSNDTYN